MPGFSGRRSFDLVNAAGAVKLRDRRRTARSVIKAEIVRFVIDGHQGVIR
jgi:hypothetical protein